MNAHDNSTTSSLSQSNGIWSQVKAWWNSISLFVRIIFVTCITIFIIESILQGSSYNFASFTYYCFNYILITKVFQIWRLFTFVFFHGGILHILFNMLALLSIGSMIEHKLGTINLALLTLLLIFTHSLMHLLILFFLSLFPETLGYYLPAIIGSSLKQLTNSCGVGFSGILFAYMVFSVHYGPNQTSFFGLFFIPAMLYPWILLIISQFLFSNVSFLGHLTGLLSGYIICYGIANRKFWKMYIVRNVERFIPSVSTLMSYLQGAMQRVRNTFQNRNSSGSSSSSATTGQSTSPQMQRFSGTGRRLGSASEAQPSTSVLAEHIVDIPTNSGSTITSSSSTRKKDGYSRLEEDDDDDDIAARNESSSTRV